MVVVSGSRVPSPSSLDAALSGRLVQAAVRQIAEEPFRHGLGPALGERADDVRSGRLVLLRSKYKPFRKLTAYYRIEAGHPSRQRDLAGARHLAVSWHVRPAEDGPVTALVSPDDPAMPQLARLSRPEHLAALLEDLSGRGIVSADRMSIGTIRYRPGQRHVLLARLVGGGGLYVKTDRDVSGSRAVPVASLLEDVLARWCPGASVADPAGYSAADSAALWWSSEGAPLSGLLARPTSVASRAVHRAGRALRTFHDHVSVAGAHPVLDRIGSYDARAEAASTLRAGEHIAPLLPSMGTTYRALVFEVLDRLHGVPTEAATFCHGDFKSGNLLVHQGRLRVLDLDRSGWADPALDLGKFLADLRWWCAPTDQAAVLRDSFRAGYGAGDPARWVRAELLCVLFQLKLAARRCSVHDAHWGQHLEKRVAVAAAALRGAGGI